MDFKKNFIVVNLQIISEPTIIHNSINDFIMFIVSEFHALMFNCLRVSVREEKRKIWLLLPYWENFINKYQNNTRFSKNHTRTSKNLFWYNFDTGL